MASAPLRADSARDNIIRFPRRRRRASAVTTDPARVLPFPDKLGRTPPPFDPSNDAHQSVWQALWESQALARARKYPEGHPLRDWWQAEFSKSYPHVPRA